MTRAPEGRESSWLLKPLAGVVKSGWPRTTSGTASAAGMLSKSWMRFDRGSPRPKYRQSAKGERAKPPSLPPFAPAARKPSSGQEAPRPSPPPSASSTGRRRETDRVVAGHRAACSAKPGVRTSRTCRRGARTGRARPAPAALVGAASTWIQPRRRAHASGLSSSAFSRERPWALPGRALRQVHESRQRERSRRRSQRVRPTPAVRSSALAAASSCAARAASGRSASGVLMSCNAWR